MNNERWTLLIHGRVQGVYYRASTVETAGELGLTGYARNLPDGSVEVVAEGDREALEQLHRWCEQGPPAARVDRTEVAHSEATGEFGTFDVRR